MATDVCYEALAAATGTDWNVGRGELNKSLALIRGQMPDVAPDLLAAEITYRAGLYRRVFPSAALTPPALAKHWVRVAEEASRGDKGTNRHSSAPCSTCDGDRFVVATIRPDGSEEMQPCPDCKPARRP